MHEVVGNRIILCFDFSCSIFKEPIPVYYLSAYTDNSVTVSEIISWELVVLGKKTLLMNENQRGSIALWCSL